MYRSLFLVVAALLAVLLVGCAAPAVGSPVDATSAPGAVETPASSPDPATSPVSTPDTSMSPVAAPTAGAAGGLTPDAANRAIEWLASEANVAVADLRLVAAEQVEWTDSCFGLGGPAELCLQAMTPGWRILFEAGGQQYEVRTDEAATSFRLATEAS